MYRDGYATGERKEHSVCVRAGWLRQVIDYQGGLVVVMINMVWASSGDGLVVVTINMVWARSG